MRKTGAVILALALCLLIAGLALAEDGPVVRSGALAAYTDGSGKIYLPGNDEAINTAEARSIAAIDAYRLLFYSASEDGEGSDLYMIDLESYEETLLMKDVYAAALLGDDLYFVPSEDRARLLRENLADGTNDTAYVASEPIDLLYLTGEGLVVQLVDNAGALIHVPETETFEVYTAERPRGSQLTDDYELFTASDDSLYIKAAGNYTAEHIDSDVMAFASVDRKVYYLTHTGSAVRLKAYDPEAMTWQVVLTPEVNLTRQLAATAGRLFVLDAEGIVYEVNLETRTLDAFHDYRDLTEYALPDDYEVTALRVEGMSGQLNVYAELEEVDAEPMFSFIEFESDAEKRETRLMLLDEYPIEDEETAWDLLKPAPQYTPLSRGSRGDAVRAIQQPLFDLGYYDYNVDGIYGPRTQYAVRLLQSDLNRPVDGVADAELQQLILSGKLSAYDPYVALARGTRGLRVQIMQERLRDLGYLADDADGIFGSRTQKAVQLFQAENGLAVNSSATRNTLISLYSEAANRCASYIDLYRGDTGYRVRELNNRLKELYYLETSVGSTYTADTASAIRVFQRTAGLVETGEATQAVQRVLFAKDAPEAPGFIPLRRGDNNNRVLALQQRLIALNYLQGRVTGYYGSATRDAVALFQKKVGLTASGVATVRTQQLLFADDAPVYVKPTVISVPVITLDAYHHRDNGVFYIDDETAENAGFTWSVEGDVKSYNARITDANGTIYVDRDILLTHLSVPVASLQYDMVYTLQITAYPQDGDAAHVTTASTSICRIHTPEPLPTDTIGQIGNPVISIDTVAREEGGVSYVQPGTVTFHWYAEGQVASYTVEIHDEGDVVVLSANTTDEQASIRSKMMNEGEIYTIFVYAIPTNGTIDNARVKFMRFALPVIELPTVTPSPVPTPTPTAKPTATPTPLPQGVGFPAISFANVNAVEGGVSWISGDTVTMSWQATGSVGSYFVEIRDAGNVSRASTTTSLNSLSIGASNLNPGEVYTLYVTAIPQGGTAADGAMSSARFGARAAATATPTIEPTQAPTAEPTPTPTEQPTSAPTAEPTATPTAEPTAAPTEQPTAEPTQEPTVTPEPAMSSIGTPVISFQPVYGIADGITWLNGDTITMSWIADGAVDSYYVEVRDASDAVAASTTTPRTSLSIDASNLLGGNVYTLYVEAIPQDTAAVSTSASARFGLYKPAETATPEPTEAPTMEPTEIPTAEPTETPTAEPTEEPTPEPTEEPTPEPTEEPTPEPTEEPTPEPTEEPTPEPTEEPTPEPTEEPTPEPVYAPVYDWTQPVDATTDPAQIKALQDRLVEWGWLSALPESYTEGELDEQTLDAVTRFQDYYNANVQDVLPPIDAEQPAIAPETLALLMTGTPDVTYINPEMQ